VNIVVVERSFEQPVSFDELADKERQVGWCLEQHRVKPVVSYLSADRRIMLCVYEAPDADSVRETQSRGELPFDHIWSCEGFGNGLPLASTQAETVVVQRQFDPPITLAFLDEYAQRAAGCMRLYRVRHEYAGLSSCGKRQFCLFTAPDTEAVRHVGRDSGSEGFRTWKASIHPA